MAVGRSPMLAGRVVVRLVAFLVVAAMLAVPGTAESQGAGDGAGPVTLVELDGAIDRVSARFLERALAEAEDKNSPIVVVRIDTPGGLLDATRDMVGDIFGSTVPVVSYVAPEGAQAASPGAATGPSRRSKPRCERRGRTRRRRRSSSASPTSSHPISSSCLPSSTDARLGRPQETCAFVPAGPRSTGSR